MLVGSMSLGSASAASRYLGEGRIHNKLEVLQVGDRILTQPADVHDAINNRFAKLFAAPTYYLPHDLWELSQTYEDFMEAINKPHIPAQYCQYVHKAVVLHGKEAEANTQRSQLVTKLMSLDDGPSLEEFQDAIHRSPRKRSGGPSGLTYDALRIVAPDIIADVYNRMLQLWQAKRFPEWMRKKHLCPLPKVDADILTPEQLRPVMLIEVLRKVWLRPIVYRIRKAWQDQGVLAGAQYGFLGGRSCANGILQLINSMEQALYEGRSLYFSSCDIAKAFDSVQRPFAEMALRRLGVPKETAHLLSFIDDDDSICVLTPYAKANETASTFSSLEPILAGARSSACLLPIADTKSLGESIFARTEETEREGGLTTSISSSPKAPSSSLERFISSPCSFSSALLQGVVSARCSSVIIIASLGLLPI
jgi:hypothetical protein